MIGPYFDGGTGLDLFAGSGGLGLKRCRADLTAVSLWTVISKPSKR